METEELCGGKTKWGVSIMSEYSMLEATIETYVDIEHLGITDFDNLTDEQVLGLFDEKNEHLNEVLSILDGFDIESDDFHDIQEKYYGRYSELDKKRKEAEEGKQVKI